MAQLESQLPAYQRSAWQFAPNNPSGTLSPIRDTGAIWPLSSCRVPRATRSCRRIPTSSISGKLKLLLRRRNGRTATAFLLATGIGICRMPCLRQNPPTITPQGLARDFRCTISKISDQFAVRLRFLCPLDLRDFGGLGSYGQSWTISASCATSCSPAFARRSTLQAAA